MRPVLTATAVERYLDENPDHRKRGDFSNAAWTLRRFAVRAGGYKEEWRIPPEDEQGNRPLGKRPIRKLKATDLELKDITRQQLINFIDIDDDGRPRRSGRTKSCYLRYVSAFFSWCCDPEIGYLAVNPSTRVDKKVEMVKEGLPERRGRWLPKELVLSVYATFAPGEPVDLRDEVLVRLYVGTARRRSEVVRLRWRDIDFGSEVIHFLTKGKGEGKPIDVPMSGALKDVLWKWRARYIEAVGPVIADLPVVCRLAPFPVGIGMRDRSIGILWGRPLAPNSVPYAIQQRCDRAGIGKVRPHDLRRTAAGLTLADIMADGVPFDEAIKSVQAFLGHENEKTTRIYLQDNPHDPRKKRAAQALNW